jgi:hypothetical protein
MHACIQRDGRIVSPRLVSNIHFNINHALNIASLNVIELAHGKFVQIERISILFGL